MRRNRVRVLAALLGIYVPRAVAHVGFATIRVCQGPRRLAGPSKRNAQSRVERLDTLIASEQRLPVRIHLGLSWRRSGRNGHASQSVLMPGSSVNYTQDRRTLALSNQLVGLLLANDRHFTEAIRMLGIRYVLLRNDIVARGFPFEPSIYERAIARECGRPHCILRTIGDLELADFGTPNGAFVLSDSWLVDGSSRLDPGVSLLLAAHYGDVARLPDPTGKQRDVFDERRRDLKGSAKRHAPYGERVERPSEQFHEQAAGRCYAGLGQRRASIERHLCERADASSCCRSSSRNRKDFAGLSPR